MSKPARAPHARGTRGDEPQAHPRLKAAGAGFPQTRGAVPSNRTGSDVPAPAHTMRQSVVLPPRRRVPRARGDTPASSARCVMRNGSAPQTRG